jgi:hypothetical protein
VTFLWPVVPNTREIRNTAFALYQQMDSMLEFSECDEVEFALIDRFKKKKAENVI